MARANPQLHVTCFTVPSATAEVLHDTGAVWDAQWRLVRAHLPDLVARQRPDVVLIGKETYVCGVPEIAAREHAPCIALAQSMSFSRWQQEFPPAVCARLLLDLRRVDLIICCAHHVAEARHAAGMNAVVTVPNGIDVSRCRPSAGRPELLDQLGIQPDATIALHVSNLKPIKRALDLVGAAAGVLRQRSNLLFVIVGDGPLRAPMERACREHGIRELFRFVGWVDSERIPDLLTLADMVVMPSASEGMSLACLEAMACGRLVIASDILGMREIISDGETGLLFRMGDVEDLAAKILLAASTPEFRARIGRAAKAYVEEHHRLEDMVDRYEAVLTAPVRDRRARG